MRILFDHQVFSWQGYGGISRYFVEQLQGLKALGQTVYLTEGFYAENVYLRSLAAFQRQSLTSFPFKGKKWLQNWMGRKHSRKAIAQWKPDVFHPTYFDPYFLKTLEKHHIPFVLTVHDMIHERYNHGSRGLFSLDAQVVQNKQFLAEKAAAVIAVSENTRLDLLQFCPDLDAKKVHVIHHGNSLKPATSAVGHSAAQPYVLFVGQRKAYKNFAWMVTQLVGLLRSKPTLALWCVGGGAFDPIETEQFKRLGIEHQIHYRVVTSDDDLALMYQQASCFVFPSQYEGFGIPVLEAFACSCPAVLNRTSSLPEVGGDAALYFDETNPDSLAACVRSVLEDPALRAQLVQKGLERATAFTWAHSAAKHLALYQSILQ